MHSLPSVEFVDVGFQLRIFSRFGFEVKIVAEVYVNTFLTCGSLKDYLSILQLRCM